MTQTPPAIEVDQLSFQYGGRHALRGVSFSAEQGCMFGVVGPNGSGKSTLLRILATLLRPSSGTARVFGMDAQTRPRAVRKTMGVVFQGSSLDDKLTVRENMQFRGKLYGMRGSKLASKIEAVLESGGLMERADDRVETLSGGMRRRVELAAALLHEPPLLLLDEPTTGLDPSARHAFWEETARQKKERELTVILTTHLMDEAERCGSLALFHLGELIALESPDEMKRKMGCDIVSMRAADASALAEELSARFGMRCFCSGNEARFNAPDGREWVGKLLEMFGERIDSVAVSKPSIEDVFLSRTDYAAPPEDAA